MSSSNKGPSSKDPSQTDVVVEGDGPRSAEFEAVYDGPRLQVAGGEKRPTPAPFSLQLSLQNERPSDASSAAHPPRITASQVVRVELSSRALKALPPTAVPAHRASEAFYREEGPSRRDTESPVVAVSEHSAQAMRGSLLDVSLEGAFISTDAELSRGDLVWIRDSDTQRWHQGRVMWRGSKGEAQGVGLQMALDDSEARSRWREFIGELPPSSEEGS